MSDLNLFEWSELEIGSACGAKRIRKRSTPVVRIEWESSSCTHAGFRGRHSCLESSSGISAGVIASGRPNRSSCHSVFSLKKVRAKVSISSKIYEKRAVALFSS